MVIPYRTAKFKLTNIFVMAIWRSTAKFNSHQYFRLYGYRMYRQRSATLAQPLAFILNGSTQDHLIDFQYTRSIRKCHTHA